MREEFIASGTYQANAKVFNLHDTPSGYQFGEDIGFCRRAIQCGYKVAVDTTVQIGHIGDFPYHPAHLGIKRNSGIDLRETGPDKLTGCVSEPVPQVSESMLTQ